MSCLPSMPKRAWRIWTTPRATLLRSKKAPALLEEIKAAVTAARATSLPASALGKAANYTLALWPKLTRFLEYPELELSNNLAENSMRPVALGRKNWIHIGSQQAGPKVAAILSVVETCRRINIPVREYLAAVLPGLAEHAHPSPRPTHPDRLGPHKTSNLHSRPPCQPWRCSDAYKLKSAFGWSLSNLVALLRQQLFVYRDLWAWIDDPFQPPPTPEALPEQLALQLP